MLYCIRTMATFNVRTEIINILYNSTIGGVLRYCLVAWCGNDTKTDIEHIDSIIDSIILKASKVIEIPQPNIDSNDTGLLIIKQNMVWTDTKHPLHVYLYITLFREG